MPYDSDHLLIFTFFFAFPHAQHPHNCHLSLDWADEKTKVKVEEFWQLVEKKLHDAQQPVVESLSTAEEPAAQAQAGEQ